ncbi:MAG TPA: glycosyltransferase [Tenuifilaceae bacterium]|nr:glycosyltransferase [Tenuifilaceae bacterium]
MDATSTKRILVSPLGWGLGHASRDIPIVDTLIKQGHTVIFAADKPQCLLIKQRFPNLETIPFPSFQVKFNKSKFQFFPLLWVAFRLPFYNIWEHFKLYGILKKHCIDIVISDNRYGLWNRKVRSIIITHQLRVIPPFPFKWAMPITEYLVKWWLKRFDEVWIPDCPDERSVAGILSKSNGLTNLCYIGHLSRFDGVDAESVFSGFQMVVVASGPEPHRSFFVDINKKIAQRYCLNCLIIEGRPENGVIPRCIDGVWIVGHLPDMQFALAVKNAQHLVLRGGYSTIMDMLALGLSGLIVPTPGQTEQEYLAEHLSVKGLFRTVKQSELLNIDIDIMRSNRVNCCINTQLQERIKQL